MKITRFIPWICENFGSILFSIFVIAFTSALIYATVNTNIHEKHLPLGTEVIVKGTTIKGTVIRWKDTENVTIAFVSDAGTPIEMTYNYNLLKRQ